MSFSGPKINVVHMYPREMSIYGDLGNVRCVSRRLEAHGFTPEVRAHNPGEVFPDDAHLVIGGGGQDSGQGRVQDDLAANATILQDLASDGTPMLVICGMYQLFGRAFLTTQGEKLSGLGILDVTTNAHPDRMIGPVVLDTPWGQVVGYENHSGRTSLASGQEPFGRVRAGFGNNAVDGTEGARSNWVIGSYLHGPLLPVNPAVANALLEAAVRRAGFDFVPAAIDDERAKQARERQIARVMQSA